LKVSSSKGRKIAFPTLNIDPSIPRKAISTPGTSTSKTRHACDVSDKQQTLAMDFDYSATSRHWFAINLLINLAKAAIYLFSFSVVFFDVYELWADVGYERLKKFTVSKYGLLYTTSLSSRDRLHHVVLLASLAVFSLTAVGGFSILGLMSQTKDFHLHLSEIVTG